MEDIRNVRIENVRLCEDHGCVTLYLDLKGNGFGVSFGGYCLGYYGQEVGRKSSGMDAVGKLMETLNVYDLYNLKNKNARAKIKNCQCVAIGDIIEDKWFSFKEYFEKNETTKKEND